MGKDKKLSLIRCFLRDHKNNLKKKHSILRFKIKFKNSTIINPNQLSYSNINNIHISENVYIDSHITLRILDECKLFIGKNTNIGPFCHISGVKNNVVIGESVLISPRVFITSSNHGYNDITQPIMEQDYTSKGDVIIGNGCWLGIGCCILSGTNIGNNSVIGANSIVTKDVPEFSIAVGNPARVIRKYDKEERKWI
jgi:acetyltransferase-like isoleucine patch superfamily enzyme